MSARLINATAAGKLSSRFTLGWLVLAVLAALFLSACKPSTDTPPASGDKPKTHLEHIDNHLQGHYVCPMHPKIIRDHPGFCPICGMALVKKKDDSSTEAYPKVKLSSSVIQEMGVRTTKVTRGDLWKFIKTVGYVSYDEDRVSDIEMNTDGWVENMAVRVVGLKVKKGQLLFELYSPEFLKAEKEFIKAQKEDHSGINAQYSQRQQSVDARDHLRYLQASESLINEIARRGKPYFRIPIYAPEQGTITRFNIYKHKYVYAYDKLLTIADTSTVWVEARVYEHQLDWLHLGMKADVVVKALPGTVYKGEVNYIYPELDPKTRSLRVRLRVPNKDGRLMPNMFAYVKIYGGPKKNILKIPREALIVTGERESVILDRGHGSFQPVDVVSGMRSENQVEILSGLKQGESIVSSGQFMIDSEANLQASFNRFRSAE
jgi:Cu(I)/Ag(I) efflux system membrane fusion protein